MQIPFAHDPDTVPGQQRRRDPLPGLPDARKGPVVDSATAARGTVLLQNSQLDVLLLRDFQGVDRPGDKRGGDVLAVAGDDTPPMP